VDRARDGVHHRHRRSAEPGRGPSVLGPDPADTHSASGPRKDRFRETPTPARYLIRDRDAKYPRCSTRSSPTRGSRWFAVGCGCLG
jgi:hypothetical protein